ncbi:hypothetical protein R1flu_019407 [Riccia fluitans]|uniref:Exocyst subunit Exo70 family protein n=1 Tax=Riccia fluitans TaxID=41844 RepID=A0ABD1ZM19_9MARC
MDAFDGEERVLATAQHIVRSLGTNETMTDDMLKILSKFDDRFSSMNENAVLKKQDSGPDAAESSREACTAEEEEAVVETNQSDIESIEKVVMQWDMASYEPARQCMLFESSREESASFLQAVDELQKVLGSLSLSQNSGPLVDQAQKLQQASMRRLEEEFRQMLLFHSDTVDPELLEDTLLGGGSTNSPVGEAAEADVNSAGEEGEEGDEDVPVARPVADLQLDLLPPEVVSDLSDIARRMIQAEYGLECCMVYTKVRKPVLEDSLGRLGVEKLTVDEVHRMHWDILEQKIKKWISAMKVAVKVLFASEGRLCDQVFAESQPIRETCFADVAQSSMMQLLSFAEAIAVSRKTPEKLFKILEMYETLRDLIPEIEASFTGEGCLKVRSEAAGILMRLGEAARGTFAEFENAIHRDTSKTPVPGGAVHPLTRYVMNYIRFLFEYTDTLKQLFGNTKKEVPKLLGEGNNGVGNLGDDDKNKNEEKSPLAVQTIWITHVLETNLDGIHATGSAASGVSRVVLKDRFKSFNQAFEEIDALYLFDSYDLLLISDVASSLPVVVIPMGSGLHSMSRANVSEGSESLPTHFWPTPGKNGSSPRDTSISVATREVGKLHTSDANCGSDLHLDTWEAGQSTGKACVIYDLKPMSSLN